jgi:hypothetical protein
MMGRSHCEELDRKKQQVQRLLNRKELGSSGN